MTVTIQRTREAELTDIILEALETVTKQSGKPWTGALSPDTRLYGYGSDIDSMALVVLLIELEERVSKRYGVPISLTDEQAMAREPSPFSTVGRLVVHLACLIDGHRG